MFTAINAVDGAPVRYQDIWQRRNLVLAIVPENDRHFVFVVEDGRALKREVVVARRRPGEVEILEGVTMLDQVIVDRTLNVRDGLPVRAKQVASREGEPT